MKAFYFFLTFFIFLFFLNIKITFSSPLDDIYYQDTTTDKNNNENDTLKDLFKNYLSSYKELIKENKILSYEASKLVNKNKKFIEKGRIKAFSKVHGGVRGKVIYIYKDFANEVKNLKLRNKDELYILTTFIDKKILINRKLRIIKYMENVSIRQTGVSGKKKGII